MAQNADSRVISPKMKELNAIFSEYSHKLKDLQAEQNEIIKQFVKELENKKIEEIKKKI